MMHELKITNPTIFTIFGATGDLARKKIFPALLDLLEQDILPDEFRIIAFARRGWDDEKFRSYVLDIIAEKGHKHGADLVDNFVSNIFYTDGTFDELEGFNSLADKLNKFSEELGGCVSRLFYFATPPRFYETIAENLYKSKAAITCSDEEGWSRILVEKPFGIDSGSAMRLETHLNKLFKPEQIFLIDHYLAKETIRNILLFRFSNSMFEPIWNSRYIEKIKIELHEELGLEGRITFYDGIGALRDVGQSHLLQMLTLVAMERPDGLDAKSVRKEREQLLKNLRFNEQLPLVKGQYRGYTSEKGIDAESKTETFFRVGAKIHNKRWKGTDFILESGKKLNQKKAEITIYFKPVEKPLCTSYNKCVLQNRICFQIQPKEGISIDFWSRKVGFDTDIEERTLSFSYANGKEKYKIPDAYEYLLFRAMIGDQMLFRSPLEEHSSWHFINRVMKEWENNELKIYPQGEDPKNIN